MSKIRRASLIVPTPRTYVRAALSKIGVPGGALGKPYTSTPYWVHSIGDAVLTGLNWPSFYMTITLSEPILFLQLFVMHPEVLPLDLHKDIRKRALRKKEREAAAAKKE